MVISYLKTLIKGGKSTLLRAVLTTLTEQISKTVYK